jgi:glycosyltransferase involved in cell wall biosynthesis
MTNIYILYRKNGMIINTLKDSLDSFKEYSNYKIVYIDDEDTTLLKYINNNDKVLIHYSLIHSLAYIYNNFDSYNILKTTKIMNEINNFTNVNIDLNYLYFTHFLINFNGTKICMIQDEYYYTNYFKNYFELVGINIIFSCIPSLYIRKIYDNLDNSIFINYLTGYTFEKEIRKPIKDREIDVFYRGRLLHFHYGELGQDKKNIGIHMKKYCDQYNLINDIKWHKNECVYGNKWLESLSNAKVTLATESGSNIFDIDGSIKKEINELLDIDSDRLDEFPEETKYSYEEITKMVDMNKNYIPQGTISPKMFEAISVGTVLVMYEGTYLNILKPGIHYIELKKDYSNIEDVIKKIKEDEYLQNMADNSYNDIIKSNKYSYKKFINMFDEIIINNDKFNNNDLSIYNINIKEIINELVKKNTTNLLIIRTESYNRDPRRDYWYESGLEYNTKLHQLCNYSCKIKKNTINANTLFNSEVYNNTFEDNITLEDINYSDYIYKYFKTVSTNSKYIKILDIISILTNFYKTNIKNIKCKKHKQYISYIKYILNSNYRTIKYVQNNLDKIKNIKLMIIPNLTNLLPGVIINILYNIPFIYDSLEYYPQNLYGDEKKVFVDDIWHKYEYELLQYVKYKYTVNPLIAEFIGQLYNTTYKNIPNCVPINLANYLTNRPYSSIFDKNTIKFLYQGGVSPCRNFEQLIKMWSRVNKNAILIIRTIHWYYVDDLIKLASELNIFNKYIFFPESVTVDNLLNGIKHDCDIGIIPYSSSNHNYQYCSPNKMGEFISMGKPILANMTDYVNKIITENDCGICVDFNDEQLFIETVNKLTYDIELRNKLSNNSKYCFENVFNWEKQSINFYNDIKNILKNNN